MRWAPFTTFLQVFVDMLNGSNVTPGTFAALGHDYRADLLDFVSAVYDLPATATQMQNLNRALPLVREAALRLHRRDRHRGSEGRADFGRRLTSVR